MWYVLSRSQGKKHSFGSSLLDLAPSFLLPDSSQKEEIADNIIFAAGPRRSPFSSTADLQLLLACRGMPQQPGLREVQQLLQ